MPKLKLKKRGRRWWIMGDPSGAIGPYATRAEAEEDMAGLKRFYRKLWADDELEDFLNGYE